MFDRKKDEEVLFLYKAILQLQTIDECSALFEDLCTIKELQSMVQRLEVAKMLHAKSTYAEISLETGASAATISRVNRCLEYGADGYKTILNRLASDSEK